jgi:hypothetical protein
MGAHGVVLRRIGAHGTGLRRTRAAFFAALAACAWIWALPAHADLDDLKVRLTADYTWDDNVSRGIEGQRLHDRFASARIGLSLPLNLTARTRLMLTASGGGEWFDKYDGLDRAFAEIQGELQYRGSGKFGAPIYGLFLRTGQDWYDTTLRDGYRASIGLTLRKPATDRVFLFGSIGYNRRDGKSEVFDNEELFVRGTLDYSVSRRNSLYFGLEYRYGDSVSTGLPALAFLDIADAVVADDVFTDRFAYKTRSHTGILTLGYNFAFAERHALDFSYRGIYSRPEEQPPSNVSDDDIYYYDNQFTVSYLFRF